MDEKRKREYTLTELITEFNNGIDDNTRITFFQLVLLIIDLMIIL